MARLFYTPYWKRFDNFLLRAIAAGSSAAAFALILTVDYQDFSFRQSPHLLTAFVVSVVACGYSVAHMLFFGLTNIVVFKFSAAAFRFFHGLFFVADELLTCALLGSAASAVVAMKLNRDLFKQFGGTDIRIDNAFIRLLIGASIEFLAFVALGLSSLMSSFYYMNLS